MFAIVLEKAGQSKVAAQMFETEIEALRYLNELRPDFTGYVVALSRVAEQFAHGVANV